MSDLMRQGPQQGGPPMGDPIAQNQSMFNPADLAGMKQTGDVTPQMTVRDFLQKMGIDVDGPVTQLQEFAQKQVQGGKALGKMQNIALAPGQGAPRVPPQGGPPTGPPERPGMRGLLKNI